MKKKNGSKIAVYAVCLSMFVSTFTFSDELAVCFGGLAGNAVRFFGRANETAGNESPYVEAPQDGFSDGAVISAAMTSTEASGGSVGKNDTGDGYSTPEDICTLMENAEKEYEKKNLGGKIREETFGAESVKNVYKNVAVKNTTDERADIEELLKRKPKLGNVTKEKPYILIYHTHTTETYELLDKGFYSKSLASRTEDTERNMVRVGDELTLKLEEAGFSVIHDRDIHDEKYTGAYDDSRIDIEKYLEKYPSIVITLDIHRDAIHYSSGVRSKPTAVINGQKAAQVMIITGCEGGKVEDFPGWENNLVFALHLQKNVEELSGGIMRPVFFCYRKYNMDVTPCSLLLEFGSDANTLEEAVYSASLVADGLIKLLEENI